MIADMSDRTDITNILQQTDLGNKENVRTYIYNMYIVYS